MGSLKAFVINNWLAMLLAVVPPIAMWYFFQRETKTLEFTILADVPVVSVQQQYAEGLVLTYRSRPINSLHILDLEARNSGNRSLERSDFDEPLRFVFSGTILSPPTVVTTAPTGLSVEFTLVDQKTLRLAPLLLNSGDRFMFRTFLVDRKPSDPAVTIGGRIKGIHELAVSSREDSKRIWSFWSGLLSALGFVLSLGALLFLFSRVKDFRALLQSLRLVDRRVKALQNEPTESHRASELARRLDIANHDDKSNSLFLRLKIENQLREIARLVNAPDRVQDGSMLSLARFLEQRDVLPHTLAEAIRDLSPTLNRELHDIESYLTPEGFDAVQQLSLSVVGQLEDLLASIRQNTTSQKADRVD